MRAPVHHDIALPALALADIVEDRDAARRLDDLAEAAAESGAEFRQSAGQTALGERNIFRAVVTVEAPRDVTGRRFRAASRRLGIVFAARTGRLLVLAGLGGLQHRETPFAVGPGDFLGFRSERRNPAVRRVHDQGRARAGP